MRCDAGRHDTARQGRTKPQPAFYAVSTYSAGPTQRQLYTTAMSQKKVNALRLIELVRQNEVLYNIKHPDFHDYSHKEAVWASIDARLNSPEGECKRKWTMLRDAYRRNLKTLQSNPDRKEFKFSHQMRFLMPYFQKIPKPVEQGEKTEYYSSFQDADSRDGPEEVQVEHMDPETFAECLLINELDEEEKSRLIGNEQMSMDVGNKQHEAIVTSNLHSNYAPYPLSSRKTDVIDGFLFGIGANLRTFSPYYLNIAKQRIFNVVSDLELEQIRARQSASAMTKVSSSGSQLALKRKSSSSAVRTSDECTSKKDKYQEKEDADKTSETEMNELNE